MAKYKVHQKRYVSHEVVAKKAANAVQYKLQTLPALARKVKEGETPNPKTAYARVVDSEICTIDRLAERVAERNPLIRPTVMRHILESMVEIIAEELQRGHQVTFEDLFSFGVSFEGRVNPEAPLDARHLPLMPWARFSKRFINDINRGVKIAYAEEVNPPKVEIDEVKVIEGVISLRGDFKHYEALAADVITAEGETIACTISATQSERLTRPHSKRLFVFPEEKANLAGAQLLLTWIDGGGERQERAFTLG